MIDPGGNQEIKRQLDAVSATLHELVAKLDLTFAIPQGTKNELLICKTLLDDIARNIGDAFPIAGQRDKGAISRVIGWHAEPASATWGGAPSTYKRSKVNWSKGIRRFWLAASLLWVIGLVSTDYAVHPIGDRVTAEIWAGLKNLTEATRADSFELLYDVSIWKMQTPWLYVIIPPIGLLGLIGISTWVYRGFVSAKAGLRSPWDSTAHRARRGDRRFQSWRDLGHALRRERRRLTRRREITPKMVFTAIVSAVLGWLLAAILNDWPRMPQ